MAMRTTASTRFASRVGPVGLVIMWSSGFIGAELGTRYAPADTLLAWRFLAAATILGSLAAGRGLRVSRVMLLRQCILGLLCQCLYLGGVVSGVGAGVPAGTAALIAAMQPLVVAALAGPFLGEAVRTTQRWGLGFGLIGVVLVVAGDLGGVAAGPAAFLLPVVGMLALCAGTLLDARWKERVGLLDAMTIQTVLAAGFFLIEVTATGRIVPPADPQFWLAVAWTVVLSSFGGYGFYYLVLRRQGPTAVSTLLYLTPATTMLWAALMFGRRPDALGLLGMVVCATAVGVVLRGARVRDRPFDAST